MLLCTVVFVLNMELVNAKPKIIFVAAKKAYFALLKNTIVDAGNFLTFVFLMKKTCNI
jgi:hypothetical protein